MTTFKHILAKIEEYDTIIIHRHMKPDPDALGSQLGLKAIIKTNFPEKKVLAPGYDEPTLTWLGHMDNIDSKDYLNALVIVTDTANRPRIDGSDYMRGQFLIKIDHHPNDDVYGDLVHVDTAASSSSEIIADFAITLQLKLSDEAARLLYAGIIGDTGRFLYPATSSKTFAIASELRNYHFDFAAVARQMDSFSLKIAKLQAYTLDNLEINENGAARLILTQDLMKKFNITDPETSAIVATPGKIDCVEVWAIFVEQPDGHYRVRLRSKSHSINDIAKRHAGGGHPLASGANSYSLKENEDIYQEIKDLLKN
ncbi:bifunctional oligoribonuclease/PAP phosphatase NrnA [Streptococcus chenjunshii]|uniref:Bifunctional oligoribonuclease/PAP phosphatase NrnA n=1 Tax=Streptococcus chenjunshii TaxID=2173853 RepID=A0A372KMV9_9STRE|nr:bifunctional oligoribonuclease/PAP phosphatase NrnA [Streptococcus chenjunshii]AXQ78995.1 bifunctional oligoribonuclease/PAP phosphatase NrnA [Streptococcus chenjunshii]RFU51422.1 bifunctional oligoribonuclease/PAP phosphatase NrnA [Streptococcus chenjunshii]RFU53622.1 bifunctional oligoribonuclease/PAP phosphatase NrnA [Streptococcus chenjunshii]